MTPGHSELTLPAFLQPSSCGFFRTEAGLEISLCHTWLRRARGGGEKLEVGGRRKTLCCLVGTGQCEQWLGILLASHPGVP